MTARKYRYLLDSKNGKLIDQLETRLTIAETEGKLWTSQETRTSHANLI